MISLIQPSRNNLKYLKWSYSSIRKNAGSEVEICVADDFSNDGTWEWCQDMMKIDPNFKAIRNDGPTRLGHTILYDKLINEVATKDIVGIWHADMYMTPGTVEKIIATIEPGKIVSLTRIEPPLHPPGPEKVLMNFGIEPEEFNEDEFLSWYRAYVFTAMDKTTEGVFAPWFIYKSDFQSIEGHDSLFAPQSKEDSDIFNRFLLNGYSFVQLWDAAIYHMTCRGSRFNPTLTTPGQNSSEWSDQNMRSSRNFIRKWGHFVKHDMLMKPIVPPKYNIAFVISKCNMQCLVDLEPWCDRTYIDDDTHLLISTYLDKEQVNTKYDLSKRVLYTNQNDPKNENDIIVEFDATKLTQTSFNIIQQLSEILKDSGEVGVFELDCFTITVNNLTEYQQDLIICNTTY